MKVSLIAYTQLAKNSTDIISEEELPGYTARISYNSKGDFNANLHLNKQLIKLDHRTPFEALHYVFLVEDVSKILLGQITRHRIGIGFTAKSGRHVNLANVNYYMPDISYIDQHDKAEQLYKEFYKQANELYQKLLDMGVRPQEARYILPASRLTSFYMYITAPALRNFFYRRLDRHAEGEINELARRIFDIVYKLHPSIYGDFAELRGGNVNG